MNVFISDEDFKVAENNNIKRNTVIKRVRYANPPWSVEDAITIPVKKYGNLPEISEARGHKSSLFYVRVSDGWDPEEAAYTPPGSKVKLKAKDITDIDIDHPSNEYF